MNQTNPECLTWLVTGGAGFIGSHLVERLLAGGHTVLALDDLSTGSLSNLAEITPGAPFEFHPADVRDMAVLESLAARSQVIVHLAAAVGVQLIIQAPVRTIEINVLGTQAVLEAGLRHGARVLLASSSEVYGKGNGIPFREDDDVLLGPTSRNRWSYAASKMIDEFLALAYQHERGLEVVPFRLFNTIGLRQTGCYGMVVPRLVGQALRGEPLTVYGNGTQSRCFCDVRDVVEAVVGLGLHPNAAGNVYNIGGTKEISILGLAEEVLAVTGSPSRIELVPYDEAYAPGFEDMQRRLPCIQRIEQLLNWRPRRTLRESLVAVCDALRTSEPALLKPHATEKA